MRTMQGSESAFRWNIICNDSTQEGYHSKKGILNPYSIVSNVVFFPRCRLIFPLYLFYKQLSSPRSRIFYSSKKINNI